MFLKAASYTLPQPPSKNGKGTSPFGSTMRLTSHLLQLLHVCINVAVGGIVILTDSTRKFSDAADNNKNETYTGYAMAPAKETP